MDGLTPQQVGAPLLQAVQPEQLTPQQILAEIGKRSMANIENQKAQAAATQDRIKELRSKKRPFNLAPLAMAVDMFAGTNHAPMAMRMEQMNRQPEIEAMRLEELLRKQQGAITDDELNLLKAQYAQAGGQGMSFADKQALLLKNKKDVLETQFDFNKRLKMMGLEAQKEKEAQKQKDKAAKASKLTPNMIKKINEGNQIPAMLEDVDATIAANKDVFGPIGGRLASMNPYNEQSKTIDAQMRAASQSFGRFMEGGVLRKEDEEKYRRMFPNLSDTPEVAANKLAIVKRLLQQKQQSDLEAFDAQGYNLEGLDKGFAMPGVPDVLSGNKGPAVGTEQEGYRFKGGDPADPNNWEKM